MSKHVASSFQAAFGAAFLFFSSFYGVPNAWAAPIDSHSTNIFNLILATAQSTKSDLPTPRKGPLPFASVASPNGIPKFTDAKNSNEIDLILKSSLQFPSSCHCNASTSFHLFRYIYSTLNSSFIHSLNASYKNSICLYHPKACELSIPPQKNKYPLEKYSFIEHLLKLSEHFLATPYVLDSLGEGIGSDDSDPLVRYDAVDCMTFVETSLALALSTTPQEVEGHLTRIRYIHGKALFENRHHFFTAQWAPEQIHRQLLRDITEELGKQRDASKTSLAVAHKKIVTKEQWNLRKNGRHFQLPPHRRPIGEFTFNYIPIHRITDIQDRLPSGAIFALVREDRPHTPFMVTHIGFVVRHSGKIWFRHAGRDLYGQVIDEEVAHYVQRAARYKKWVVLGMRFFEVLPQKAACSDTSTH